MTELDESIRTKEENLAFIKQREKRSIIYFTSYSILIWFIYILLWWFGALDYWTSSSSSLFHDGEGDGESSEYTVEDDLIARILKTLPVGTIPIL